MLSQIRLLQSSNQMPRSNIVTELRLGNPASWQGQNDDLMAKSVALCYSLRLSIHIYPDTDTRFFSTQSLRWDGNESISTVVSNAFPSNWNSSDIGVIEQKLTLEYLSSFYGFKIFFIDNLVDHLTIQRTADENWLLIYQHKIFLKNELRFGSLLPQSLVEEALDTLNLLLPYDDEKTAKFLRRQSMEDFHSLGPCNRSRKTDLSEYKYFQARIAHLCAVIKDEPPIGIQQLMPGWRGSNLREFLNFWIAVFVGVLTIFSIAFGITALVYAKWAYDVALLQYQLSLAQACSEPDAVKTLPGFC
ncbi:hypothetical protein PFICI_09840 [Pestalotiopsis fici W106-1]|uniref:Uncharacterized protein n=1 Tax=Pestalotiopsis fici (strain W106-1 / CGMCC3.15140) TaxID=1229662 RepID=W3WV83_PESFW|nr:uncharacterized protein PFICI_09840 [Pestalotiopsis fici W106-1]ETS77778.1 hypothetical protein PFICI_09840 [Pestalotiopsis fici W106-1]